MPLPRFHRLTEAEQSRLLALAARHIAARGLGEISLNDLAEEAGVSRSALYNYFDGREDVISAATEAALVAVADQLGAWEPRQDESSFWASFHVVTERLQALLVARPELRAILKSGENGIAPWVAAFFSDAVRLGMVNAPNRPLALAATGAVIAAADALELSQPGTVTSRQLQELLQRLWS